MPAPTTIDELLELVRKSGVVDDKRLTAHVERLRASGQLPAEPNRLAGLLVRDGVLTHFQAEQFLQGKWRRFTIGKYKVLERLGAGGMGSVYLCEHTLMRRRVAVKVLPATKASDSSCLERFQREARAVAALDHPNIVRAYDIDKEDNLHYLVMEHVDGSSLQDIVKRHGPMDVLRAAHYIFQAALGLQHAHEAAGLVHRDIKPGNILVDRNGIVKILDMGLARFFNDEEDILTKKYDENVLGTADYLAPEQALDSHSVDIRADIYSLGGTFYYCLTGRTPFAEGTVPQKLIWHQTRQPKPILTLRPEVPEGLVAIVERMMLKDRAQRYQTPQEVADALAAWTKTPIPPPPEHEMPQFSPAASSKSGSGTVEGGMSSASRETDDAPPPPAPAKPWQVTAPSPAGTATVPVLSSPMQPTPPVVRPAPVPGSKPLSPPRSAPRPPPAAPAPPASTPPRPVSAPAARPAPVVNGAAQPAAVTTAAPPLLEIPPDHDQETTNEPATDDQLQLPRSLPGLMRRIKIEQKPKTGRWLMWVGALAAVLLALSVALYFYLTSGTPPPPDGPTVRPPIHVPAGEYTLSRALRGARAGDRFILDGDIIDCNLEITKPRISLEPAAGKTVTLRCPADADPQTKLVTVQTGKDGVPEGVTIKGITLDGGKRAEVILLLYGKTPGLTLTGLTLDNTRQYGILAANCAGSAEQPVQINDVTFHTTAGQTALRFEIYAHSTGTVKQNGFIAISDRCKFLGDGRKVTVSDLSFVDLSTIKLPNGVTVEKVP